MSKSWLFAGLQFDFNPTLKNYILSTTSARGHYSYK